MAAPMITELWSPQALFTKHMGDHAAASQPTCTKNDSSADVFVCAVLFRN
jgi:hypothetical protein